MKHGTKSVTGFIMCKNEYRQKVKSRKREQEGVCMQDKTENSAVSRRDFLKFGAAAAVGGATTLGIGALAGCAQDGAGTAGAKAVKTEIELLYTCPIDGRQFADYEAVREHFLKNHPDAAVPEVMSLVLNGEQRHLQVEPQWTLQETLQHAAGITSAKTMCDRGGCGSCSVLVDGRPALSCTLLAVECEGKDIQTAEGIAADEKWRPLFDAFAAHDGSQCGYCSPGHIVVAKYIVETYGEPTEEQIDAELASNICRCGTYKRHAPAILDAVKVMKGGSAQ
jgi:xanthine dehydrogenase YagT iron-sulfur-binding subunit